MPTQGNKILELELKYKNYEAAQTACRVPVLGASPSVLLSFLRAPTDT